MDGHTRTSTPIASLRTGRPFERAVFHRLPPIQKHPCSGWIDTFLTFSLLGRLILWRKVWRSSLVNIGQMAQSAARKGELN